MHIWIRICYPPIELDSTEQKNLHTVENLYRLCGIACEAHASKSAQCLRVRWYLGNLKLLARHGRKGGDRLYCFCYLRNLCARWGRQREMCY